MTIALYTKLNGQRDKLATVDGPMFIALDGLWQNFFEPRELETKVQKEAP